MNHTGHHLGSTFTETDRNGQAQLPHRARLCGPCRAAVAGFHKFSMFVYIRRVNVQTFFKGLFLCAIRNFIFFFDIFQHWK